VRNGAVDPDVFFLHLLYTEGYLERGTSAVIKYREATKTTFLIKKNINLTDVAGRPSTPLRTQTQCDVKGTLVTVEGKPKPITRRLDTHTHTQP